MPDRKLYRAQRPELVDLVVRDERISHVFKAEALLAGADEFPTSDFPDAFLQKLSRGALILGPRALAMLPTPMVVGDPVNGAALEYSSEPSHRAARLFLKTLPELEQAKIRVNDA